MRRAPLTVLLACALAVPPEAIVSGVPRDCAGSLAALSQLKSEVAADAALTRLTGSLAEASQPTAAQLVQAEDAALARAVGAGNVLIEQAARAADSLRAARQRVLADRVAAASGDFQRAFTTIDGRIWPEHTKSRPPSGAAFVRPRVAAPVVYEAVGQYQQALDSFEQIVANAFAQAEPGYRLVLADPDLPPPPNPSDVTAWEEVRRMRGRQVQARLGALGYRSIGAIRGKQPAQAVQFASRMRDAAREAQQNVDGLARLLAPCNTPQPQQQAKGGKSGPNKLGLSIALGMAAAGAGAFVISKALAGGASNDPDGGGASGGPPVVRSFSTWTCTPPLPGGTCTGTVTIEFFERMSSGSITVVSTSEFRGQATVNPSAVPGVVTFTMTRPFNTCYQTQRELAIWNATNTNGPQTYGLTGLNIPVSCL